MRKTIMTFLVAVLLTTSTTGVFADTTANTSKESAAKLSALTISTDGGSSITFSPAFNPDKMNYTTNVFNTTDKIQFYLSTDDENAIIYLNGEEKTNKATTSAQTLNEGINTFTVEVVATETDKASSTYKINIYRQAAQRETMVSLQNFSIDGVAKTMYAYNVNGNNFLKLRDVANALLGTSKQFSVGYSEETNGVILTSGSGYSANGQENVALGTPLEVGVSTQQIFVDGTEAQLMAYNIDGNNYVMLRDMGLLFDFGVTYSVETETVSLSTTTAYLPN